MKTLFLLTFSFLFINNVFAQIKYNNYFTEKALRLNLMFLTDKQNTFVALHSFAQEEKWAGGKNSLIYPDYGNYKITLACLENNKIIFSKGFSNLSHEWQQSHISQGKLKSFEQVVHTPMPKNRAKATLYKREKGQWKMVYQQEINPSDPLLIKEKPTYYPIEQIWKAKTPQKAIDLVILPEGYTAEQMNKFVDDAKRMILYLFENDAFEPYKDKFNVTLVKKPSIDSGTDNGGENSFKKTAFNTHFYTFNIERYLTCPSLFAAADAAAIAGGYDQLFILVNTSKHGGGAFYNTLNVSVSDSPAGAPTFVHELGHGFAGLADEYYNNTGDALGDEFYSLTEEPWEENITTLQNFKIKWADLIEDNTPIPTPRTYTYENKVGVFQGGGYSPKGVYSPMQECIMKTLNTPYFCPVCKRNIAKTIDFLTQ